MDKGRGKIYKKGKKKEYDSKDRLREWHEQRKSVRECTS